MGTNATVQNLTFWHWYPELLVRDLTPEQLAWQPEGHDTSVQFAIWHAYRAEDEILHGLLIGGPSVFTSERWAERLPVESTGMTPFGNGMTRAQIGALRFGAGALLAYAAAVGARVAAYARDLPDADAAAEIALPFFQQVYPTVATMTRADAIAFFAIGHVSEHLGEVQFLRGLMGLKGAPL